MELLRSIDRDVHGKVRVFQGELTEEGKLGALGTFSFYLGMDSDPRMRVLLGDRAAHSHE